MSHRGPLLTRRALLGRGAVLTGAAAVGAVSVGRSGHSTPDAGPMSQAGAVTSWPAWIPSGMTNNYDATTQVFNYKPSNTARHRAALLAAGTGTGSACEVFIGDSSTDGFNGKAYDRAHSWPSVYATALAASGVATSGTGWVRAADAGGVGPRWSYGAGWVDVTLFRYSATPGAAATFASDVPGTTVVIRYNAYANASFTVSVDGATSGPGFAQVTVGAATNYQTVLLTDLADATHSVVVTCTGKTLVMLLAGAVYTPGAGLTISNVAQGGAKATGTGINSWSDFANGGAPGGAWAATGHYLQTPSTVWISLGGNDIFSGVAPATVAAAVRAIAARFPDSDVFLVLEYQANEITTAAWTAYAAALYQVADTLNVPLFDQWARIGSYASYSAAGYAGDAIAHLNAAGYTALGTWTAAVAGVTIPQQVLSTPPPPAVNVVADSGPALSLPETSICAISLVTLTADCVLTFPTAVPGSAFDLVIAQSDATHGVTWPSNARWPGGSTPVLSTSAGAADRFSFLCVDGSNWLAGPGLTYPT